MKTAQMSRSPSDRAIQSASFSVVSATKRRLTALLLVPRVSTLSGRVSSERSYFLVATPIAICSRARTSSGSLLESSSHASSGTSFPSRSTTERDATSSKSEFASRRSAPRCSSRGIVLVAFAAELRPFGFEHRAHGLQSELVHQGKQVAADERGERNQQLRPDRRLVSRRFLGRLLHGGSFLGKHPEIPSGPGGTATLKFQQSAGRRPRGRCLRECPMSLAVGSSLTPNQ